MRETPWRSSEERGREIDNGNRIPDYTSAVAKARAAFTDVRMMFQGVRGIHYGLLYPARLRVSYDDEDKEFLDPMKAMEFIQKKVIPFTEPQV